VKLSDHDRRTEPRSTAPPSGQTCGRGTFGPRPNARPRPHAACTTSRCSATTELFENRDYRGSTHFFFDIGNGNSLAFFDMPGLDLGPYAEVLGGLHHLAISVEPTKWAHLKAKLDERGVGYAHIDGTSIYFAGPDGERIELIADPLGEMYGSIVL
jgi:hypothetical protein